MNTLKLFISKTLKSNIVIACAMLFSFLILSARIALTKTGYFLFLLWNIFLALIPYLITMHLSEKKRTRKIVVLISFGIWLLFLPNAPYILTDLFHLKRSQWSIIWLDTLVISSFAITGMLLYYYSLAVMLELIKKSFNFKYENILGFIICTLSAFGIYLGRFLRYNSWEVLSNPNILFFDIYKMITQPLTHQDVWLFTTCFGLFLSIGFYVFKHLTKLNSN